MSIKRISNKVMLSEIGRVLCINCHKVWGEHLGTSCPHGDGEFEPEGFSLDERCKNCHDFLRNHEDNAICAGRKTVFERANDMFSEEDFLL